MTRSRINAIVIEAKRFFEQMQFHLPPWAFWAPKEWRGRGGECREIIERKLGWDVTSFGSPDFERCGLVLFALRNGTPHGSRRPYAEKIMVVDEEQETPLHYHWNKTEDIINRGGGNLVLQLFPANEADELADTPIPVQIDGRSRIVPAGGMVTLTPGESITLEPRVYHRFYAEPGRGRVLTGEVSKVNDDDTDNRFLEPRGRYPEVVEDEPPLHLLVSDYPRYL